MQNLANHLDPLEDIQSHKVKIKILSIHMVDSMLTKVMVQSLIQNALGATEVSKTK